MKQEILLSAFNLLVTMLSFIQSKILVTLAYTPGFLGTAHPYPKLTIPAITALPLSLQTNGPPESPWQESLPPSGYAAQSMESVITNVPSYKDWHSLLVIVGTLTYWSLSG